MGMLITQVPRCFEGSSFRLFRESQRQRKQAEMEEVERWRAEARRVLADPRSGKEERNWACIVLEE